MSFELHDPWLLLLALPFVLLWVWRRRRPRRVSVRFPTLASVPRRRSLRVRLLPLPRLLFFLGVGLLLVALARPRQGEARSIVRREGIAIGMVLDRSGSMDEPMSWGSRELPRIEIVKDVFTRFVRGGQGLPGRKTDLLGLTTFARFPEEACPLVTFYEPLLTAVRNLSTVAPYVTAQRVPTRDPREASANNPLSATAIGDALYRGVLTLVTAEDDLARSQDMPAGYRIQGKVLILLTDGRNNAGRDPGEVADLAKENGIRIYYILLMERDITRESILGRRVTHHLSEREVEQLLEGPRQIAEASGGKAWFASDGDALEEVYAEIDRLERVEVGTVEYTSHRELFPWLLLGGLVVLLLGAALEETWLRRAP